MTIEFGPHLTTAVIVVTIVWLLLTAYRIGGRR